MTYKFTKKELKIYNAILKAFPATSKATARAYALAGGVKFNFIHR